MLSTVLGLFRVMCNEFFWTFLVVFVDWSDAPGV